MVARAPVLGVLGEEEGVVAAEVGGVLHAGAAPLHPAGVDDGHGVEVRLAGVPLALDEPRDGAVVGGLLVVGDVVGDHLRRGRV